MKLKAFLKLQLINFAWVLLIIVGTIAALVLVWPLLMRQGFADFSLASELNDSSATLLTLFVFILPMTFGQSWLPFGFQSGITRKVMWQAAALISLIETAALTGCFQLLVFLNGASKSWLAQAFPQLGQGLFGFIGGWLLLTLLFLIAGFLGMALGVFLTSLSKAKQFALGIALWFGFMVCLAAVMIITFFGQDWIEAHQQLAAWLMLPGSQNPQFWPALIVLALIDWGLVSLLRRYFKHLEVPLVAAR